MEPTICRRIVVAADVKGEGTKSKGRTVNGRRKSIELVQRHHRRERCTTTRIVDTQGRVDALQDVAVAHAEALVGRLAGELVAPKGQPAVSVVDALEAHIDLRIRLGLLA